MLSIEQVAALLRILKEPTRTMVFVAVFTGLRVGELLGLKWSDIDLQKMVVHVVRSIVMQHVGDCKTEAPANRHGRNFDALRDSIAGGEINKLELPYKLVIRNYDKIRGEAKEMADDFIDLVNELAAEGCPLEVCAEGSSGGSKRSRIQQSRLDEMEAAFQQSLIPLLKECAAGRWGLFDKMTTWKNAGIFIGRQPMI